MSNSGLFSLQIAILDDNNLIGDKINNKSSLASVYPIEIRVEPCPLVLQNFSSTLWYQQGLAEVVLNRGNLGAEISVQNRSIKSAQIQYLVIGNPENGTLLDLAAKSIVSK